MSDAHGPKTVLFGGRWGRACCIRALLLAKRRVPRSERERERKTGAWTFWAGWMDKVGEHL